jgi:hypothetical protein
MNGVIRKGFRVKWFFLIVFTTALIFLPGILFAQTGREPAYNIVITPITYDSPELEADSGPIYDSVINEFGWQGQLQSLYRLVQTDGNIGDPPALSNLPPDAQAENPRYVVTLNLYIDGSERVITMNLYSTPNFDLVGNQEMAYTSLDNAMGMLAFFCWSLSSNLPPDDRTTEPEIIYIGVDVGGAETDVEAIARKSKWLYLGLQGGLSFRLYNSTEESDTDVFTAGTTFNAGLRLELQFAHFMIQSSYFSFSFESGVDITQEKLDWKDYTVREDEDKRKIDPLSVTGEGSSGLNLAIPGLLKFNYKPGIFSTSLYGGGYYILPLDNSEYSLPVGITGGINMGVKLGPGILYLDFQYAHDLGNREMHYTLAADENPGNTDRDRIIVYTRQMFTLAVGYKFGFLDRQIRQKAQEEEKQEVEAPAEP